VLSDGVVFPDEQPRQGLLVVRTRSGTHYLIDLDAMRLQRIPSDNAGPDAPGCYPVSQPLRRDRHWLKIIHLGPLTVGNRLELVLEPLGDAHITAVTLRLTTEVQSITTADPLNGPAKGDQRA
jgi:hypothetical protein